MTSYTSEYDNKDTENKALNVNDSRKSFTKSNGTLKVQRDVSLVLWEIQAYIGRMSQHGWHQER
jgi:hypothetical protein